MIHSITDYKACIFDLDGTLLDSMGVWKYVDEQFLGKRGLPVTDEYIKAVSFMKLNAAAEYTVKLFDLNYKPRIFIRDCVDFA